MIQQAVGYDLLRSLSMISLHGLPALVKGGMNRLSALSEEGFLKQHLNLLTIGLCSHRIISLLDWFINEIVCLEKGESGLISAVYHHPQLQVVELIFSDSLDVGDFDRIVLNVNSYRTVCTKEDAMIDAHVCWIFPACSKRRR